MSTPNGQYIAPAEWQLAVRTAPLRGGDLSIQVGGGGGIPLTSDVGDHRRRSSASRWASAGRRSRTTPTATACSTRAIAAPPSPRTRRTAALPVPRSSRRPPSTCTSRRRATPARAIPTSSMASRTTTAAPTRTRTRTGSPTASTSARSRRRICGPRGRLPGEDALGSPERLSSSRSSTSRAGADLLNAWAVSVSVHSSERSRHLVAPRLGRRDAARTRSRRSSSEEQVACGWLRASGVLADVELRAFDAELGTLGSTRRIAGPVQVLALEGSIGLVDGEPSFSLRARARARDRPRPGDARGRDRERAHGRARGARDGARRRDARARARRRRRRLARSASPRRPRRPAPARAAKPAVSRSSRRRGPSALEASEPRRRLRPARYSPAGAPAATLSAPMPQRPRAPADGRRLRPVPEPGDAVEHFAFGRADVMKSDGDRLHLKIHKDGRIRGDRPRDAARDAPARRGRRQAPVQARATDVMGFPMKTGSYRSLPNASLDAALAERLSPREPLSRRSEEPMTKIIPLAVVLTALAVAPIVGMRRRQAPRRRRPTPRAARPRRARGAPACRTRRPTRRRRAPCASRTRSSKACGISEPDAYFAFDSANVRPDDARVLDQVATCFSSGPLKGRTLKLVGHADPRGGSDYNMTLGQSRADAVAELHRRQGPRQGQDRVDLARRDGRHRHRRADLGARPPRRRDARAMTFLAGRPAMRGVARRGADGQARPRRPLPATRRGR